MVCDGPLLPQADPPCSEGVDSAVTSNPEVQHPSANPRLHPVNGRQREPFRAVTWLQNTEGPDESGADEWRTRCWGTAKEDRDDKEGSGVLTTDYPTGDPPDDWETRTSGAGCGQHKLRPCLGKSVASSADINKPGGYMNINIQTPGRQREKQGHSKDIPLRTRGRDSHKEKKSSHIGKREEKKDTGQLEWLCEENGK
ncbi:hypothetical protein NDU88_004596 [Pleurodeles waltl]|uniref:Uncharacterized protein n=1 Tax=Pleurodeles waltl TaxID=8319 RepID=A0AAV7SJA5_PLEWA|nr:hypothetical protein NDU88_004596 [Pleurodeles waltl]